MKAKLRDMIRALAKERRPKKPEAQARVIGRGFTQQHGRPVPATKAQMRGRRGGRR